MSKKVGQSRIQQLEAEKNVLFQKDWVKNNTAFTYDQIEEFYELFKLLADSRTNKIFVEEILQTAKTLGIDSKYGLVYKVLEKFQNETGDQGVDFETFVKELTKRVGSNATVEGRKTIFETLSSEDPENLSFEDLKRAAKEGRYNLTDAELEEVIKRIVGPEVNSVSYAAFEKYMKRRVEANKK